MTIHTRELYRADTSPANTAGDAWSLVFDETVRTLRVEHEQGHGPEGSNARMRCVASTYDLEHFLSRTHDDDPDARVAKQRLIGMLKELFDGGGATT